MDEMSKHGLFVFPPKKTVVWRRSCSIGQSCCSVTSKQSIGWFLESSLAWSFFTQPFAYPTKSHARLCPFDQPIISLYFGSFVVSVLFVRFHFKVIRKSPYPYTNSPNWSLYFSIKNTLREFDKRSKHFILVIILSILTTFSLNCILILLGENWCLSLSGLKGLLDTREVT